MKSLGAFVHGDDDPWQTFGTEELCTWHDWREPGICMIQTRSPKFARKLSQRSDTSPAGPEWVSGDYLRIFSIRMEAWQARRLVTQYLTNAIEVPFLRPTNGGFRPLESPPRGLKAGNRVKTADNGLSNSLGIYGLQTHPRPRPNFDPTSRSFAHSCGGGLE